MCQPAAVCIKVGVKAILPFALQWAIGGYAASSAVSLWALVVALGAVLPDLVDGVLGGPWLLHSVTGSIVLLVVVMLATIGRRAARKRWLGLFSGEADAQHSLTYYAIVDKVAPRCAWLSMKPLTGRTHQLRVHCASMGWAIVGDPIYGSGPREGGPGLQLHARGVSIPISANKAPIAINRNGHCRCLLACSCSIEIRDL